MNLLRNLLKKLFPSDKRTSSRKVSPNLVAYLWTGGYVDPKPIRDLSKKGLFLLTHESWYPGTLVRLVLQHKEVAEGTENNIAQEFRSITVQTIVARREDDGLGLAFCPLEGRGSGDKKNVAIEGANKKELEKFLSHYLAD
jgi:hypothetical protein